jgi:hypothetical protein
MMQAWEENIVARRQARKHESKKQKEMIRRELARWREHHAYVLRRVELQAERRAESATRFLTE